MIRKTLLGFVLSLALPGIAFAAPLPRVAIVTNAGTIVVELDTKRAPITTKNFLHLVDTRAYDGATFYRTVSKAAVPGSNIEVIQGGLQGVNRIPDQKIALEQTSTTHLHNTSGAISMARTSDPNSGSSEFFLCVGDNTFLDAENQPDHLGYAAFGHVVRGNDVVLKINHSAATSQMLTAPVTILRMRRVPK